MQSFSKITKRQAEHSRIMWVTYLVVALIIGSTVLWLFQDDPTSLTKSAATTEIAETMTNNTNLDEQLAFNGAEVIPRKSATQSDIDSEVSSLNDEVVFTVNNDVTNTSDALVQKTGDQNISPPSQITLFPQPIEKANLAPVKSAVTFFFKGDCWVNIYDSTGERIAWGLKKSDYVMNITGVAPFTVTLGRPELVTINFNGVEIDMTQFTSGNIAKFNLPVTH